MKKPGYTLALTTVSIVAMSIGVFVSVNELQRRRVLSHYKKAYDSAQSEHDLLTSAGTTDQDARVQTIKRRLVVLEQEMTDVRQCWHVSSLVDAKQKENDHKVKKLLALSTAMIDIYKKGIQESRNRGLSDKHQQIVFAAIQLHEALATMIDLEKRFKLLKLGYLLEERRRVEELIATEQTTIKECLVQINEYISLGMSPEEQPISSVLQQVLQKMASINQLEQLF